MGDYEQCGSPNEHAVQGALKVLWVECAKAFIEDDDVGMLQECPCDIETTTLTMRELPSRLPHHLPQPGWHAAEQVTEAEESRQTASASWTSTCWGGQERPNSKLKANVPVKT